MVREAMFFHAQHYATCIGIALCVTLDKALTVNQAYMNERATRLWPICHHKRLSWNCRKVKYIKEIWLYQRLIWVIIIILYFKLLFDFAGTRFLSTRLIMSIGRNTLYNTSHFWQRNTRHNDMSAMPRCLVLPCWDLSSFGISNQLVGWMIYIF